MLKTSKAIERQARAFYAQLAGKELTDTADPAWPLILAAFHLYDREWNDAPAGRRFDIAEWRWPFEMLEGGNFSRAGLQTWTVLFAAACKIVHEREEFMRQRRRTARQRKSATPTQGDIADFAAFCRNATLAQLIEIKQKERKAGRITFAEVAQTEQDRRA